MSSFFEKLKKGMGTEAGGEPSFAEEQEPEKDDTAENGISLLEAEEKPKRKTKKIKEMSAETKPAEENKEVPEEKTQAPKPQEEKEEWFNAGEEGELAIDVYQTEKDLVIQSAVAGIRPESLEVSIEKDVLSVRGVRRRPIQEKGDYFTQECFWGPFSREIILPVEVNPNETEATMKEGVLTIRIPKIIRDKKKAIVVKG